MDREELKNRLWVAKARLHQAAEREGYTLPDIDLEELFWLVEVEDNKQLAIEKFNAWDAECWRIIREHNRAAQ